MLARDEMPSTLQRSPKKAQRVWSKAHDSAVESYGEGERAHRTAFAALKHQFQKVGDRWESKGSKGPSDAQARRSTPQSRKSRKTAGGVNANAPRTELYDIARRLNVKGRSRMSKSELVDAIQRENDRRTRRSRS